MQAHDRFDEEQLIEHVGNGACCATELREAFLSGASGELLGRLLEAFAQRCSRVGPQNMSVMVETLVELSKACLAASASIQASLAEGCFELARLLMESANDAECSYTFLSAAYTGLGAPECSEEIWRRGWDKVLALFCSVVRSPYALLLNKDFLKSLNLLAHAVEACFKRAQLSEAVDGPALIAMLAARYAEYVCFLKMRAFQIFFLTCSLLQ